MQRSAVVGGGVFLEAEKWFYRCFLGRVGEMRRGWDFGGAKERNRVRKLREGVGV